MKCRKAASSQQRLRLIVRALAVVILPLLSYSAQAQSPIPDAPPPASTNKPNFFHRLTNIYSSDWFPDPNAPASPAPERRGLPSPLNSPPIPFSDWPYGGAPTLGEPDTSTYPLSSAIGLDRTRYRIYGWIEPSVNFSTSTDSNGPVADNIYPNSVVLDRIAFIAERLPHTVQRDHIDWGFHITNIFGTDYRFNLERGALTGQFTEHNNLYGYETPFDYFDLYLPHLAHGSNIRIGRFSAIPGIEIQIPTFNYMFSHSLVNVVAPVTDTGILATIPFNEQWLLQLGVTGGHDVTLWSGHAKPSAVACLSYTTKSVNDNIYACANGINDGKYGYNNVQHYDVTWYHRFTKTLHMASEAEYMYQLGVPAVDGPIQPIENSNAAFCHFGQITCTAPAYAIDNYINKEFSAHDYISFRTDFLNDQKGQRTGYQTRYYENTLSWTHWFGTTVQIRPEIRYDHSFDRPAYDNGATKNQFIYAIDIVYHY
jgi:hypothetical protein